MAIVCSSLKLWADYRVLEIWNSSNIRLKNNRLNGVMALLPPHGFLSPYNKCPLREKTREKLAFQNYPEENIRLPLSVHTWQIGGGGFDVLQADSLYQ